MSAITTQPCRWLIDCSFELRTPLHLGCGQSELDKQTTPDNEETWVSGIVLNHEGKAVIPGASLKGALRAFAERHGLLLSSELKNVFGSVDGNRTNAGQAEFRYVIASANVVEVQRSHVAIDRVTGTAMDKKLYKTRLIPAGTRFSSQIVLHRASQSQVEALLALLQFAGRDATFTVGAHASQGLGAIQLAGQPQIKRFGPAEAANWLRDGGSGIWEKHAVKVTLPSNNQQLTKPLSLNLPKLPLLLDFHSPFLVKGGVEKRRDSDVTVPMMQGKSVILPASSLRGRLRSQAERILRTLGLNVPQGHDAKPWRKGEAHTDIAALLFGSAGWRAVVGASECTDKAETSRLKTQELLAIDRFTGGGKDGAKFSIEAAECPTLAGQLHLDLRRLKKTGDACWPALGLFTLVLRDLAEGDIAFGYGIAKGFGKCREKQVLAAWGKLLSEHFPEQSDPVAHALSALRQLAPKNATTSQPLQVSTLSPAEFKPTPNSSGFFNPYHFIPLSKPDTTQWTSPEQLQTERGHDRYHGLSGRITCKLTTKTPMFIGAKRHDSKGDEPACLDAYEFQGKRAIPATSLRGMISSLFESISGSGLRVLHPQPYSMRNKEGALSAMGRVLIKDGRCYLKPLTLPTLNEGRGEVYPLDPKWKKISAFSLKNTDGYAPLRVYFDTKDLRKYQQPGPYYMEVAIVDWDGSMIAWDESLRHPSKRNKSTGTSESNFTLVIGQKPLPLGVPISEEEHRALPKDQQENYIRGWVRTLETPDRPKGKNELLPTTVKHLVFLPDPAKDKDELLLPMTTRAYNTFHQIADLATASMPKDRKITDGNLLPFVPAGREKNKDRLNNPDTHVTRLQHGDLIFFDIDDNGKISEISFSSMWRTGIRTADGKKLATTADLLAQLDPDLLPLGMGERKPLFSPVDLLFGVVEYREPGNKKANAQNEEKKQALALAGRVVIGIAQADAAQVKTDPAITLKELSSPKPPSPALYFKPIENDGYVSKAELAKNSSDYTLRGRKTYLHAWRDEQSKVVRLDDQGRRSDQQGREPWASKHHGRMDEGHKRRVKIEPITTGQTFTFNIDFHNLSERELQQLCATLQPDPAFEHRLGMGKPLGLGSVKVQITDLQLVDRKIRYTNDALTTERSHQTLSASEISSLAAAGMQIAHPDVRRALQLLGNPTAVAAPVHYPQVDGGMLEDKHFSWFMTNDDLSNNNPSNNREKALKAITSSTTSLGSLTRLTIKDKDTGNSRTGGHFGQKGGAGKRL